MVLFSVLSIQNNPCVRKGKVKYQERSIPFMTKQFPLLLKSAALVSGAAFQSSLVHQHFVLDRELFKLLKIFTSRQIHCIKNFRQKQLPLISPGTTYLNEFILITGTAIHHLTTCNGIVTPNYFPRYTLCKLIQFAPQRSNLFKSWIRLWRCQSLNVFQFHLFVVM